MCIYHGIPAERAELRRTVMARPGTRRPAAKPAPGKSTKSRKQKSSKASGSKGARKSTVVIDSEEEAEYGQPQDVSYTAVFPVVLTTYEIIIKDRTHLQHYNWGYIVVDEGHRLKNLDCKLMKEIKKYGSAGRMILTGTPLHVRSRFSPIEFVS